MPPNTNTLLIFQDTAYNCKKKANPYSDEKRGNLEESTGLCDCGIRREIEEPEETEQGLTRLRITQRVKQTYELYSYTKNAMLIVTSRVDAVLWTRLVNDLKRTFEEYRFEVHVCFVADPGELYANCEQFFRRDFTDYGAVALAIVTTMAVNPPQTRSDDAMFFEESVVVDNFRLDRNATLAGKPKIYITEANRRDNGRSYHDLSRLDWSEHGEIIGFHMPYALPDDYKGFNLLGSYDSQPRPLKILCNKMAAMGETRAFAEILEETITDAVKGFPLLKAIKIGLVSCLSKELYFARNE